LVGQLFPGQRSCADQHQKEHQTQKIKIMTTTYIQLTREQLAKRGGASNAQYHIKDIELFVWNRNGTKV